MHPSPTQHLANLRQLGVDEQGHHVHERRYRQRDIGRLRWRDATRALRIEHEPNRICAGTYRGGGVFEAGDATDFYARTHGLPDSERAQSLPNARRRSDRACRQGESYLTVAAMKPPFIHYGRSSPRQTCATDVDPYADAH